MNGFAKSLAATLAANKFFRAISGWGAWFLSSFLFDDVLYPTVIGWLGVVWGGGIMASLAIATCWYWLKMVVASDKEWFGMDVMHKLQKIVFWAVRCANRIPFVKKSWVDKIEFVLTFVAINIKFDPMIAVLYYRHGDTAKVLSQKDEKIFFWSAIVSNTYWIAYSWCVANLVIHGWKVVIH